MLWLLEDKKLYTITSSSSKNLSCIFHRYGLRNSNTPRPQIVLVNETHFLFILYDMDNRWCMTEVNLKQCTHDRRKWLIKLRLNPSSWMLNILNEFGKKGTSSMSNIIAHWAPTSLCLRWTWAMIGENRQLVTNEPFEFEK
jgi:hypothetical protein